MGASPLDEGPGIGPSRKKALLLHFGTASKVRAAALEDLQRAPGVSATVARKVSKCAAEAAANCCASCACPLAWLKESRARCSRSAVMLIAPIAAIVLLVALSAGAGWATAYTQEAAAQLLDPAASVRAVLGER